MTEAKIKLEDFLEYINLDTYIELYNGDMSVTGLVYEGILRDLLENKESYHEYLEMLLRPECVSIDPPGVLYILIGE